MASCGQGSARSVGDSSGQIACPKCGSTQIAANKKGFQLTRAAGAAYLFGPLGVFAGLIGSNTVVVTCLKCGNQWEPGK
jgi:predicted RNA-binding Zn-ribbon protein involved in translation (DUF1610 family)